jgi:predicted glycogen debranching enzyme
MTDPIRRLKWPDPNAVDTESLLAREWLVTNGLGGYAAGTIGGVLTRRFHGLLIAALPSPWGRRMMLNYLAEQLRFADGRVVQFGGANLSTSAAGGTTRKYLTEFRLVVGLPVWTYQIDGILLEKRVLMPHRQNTVHISYRLLDPAAKVRLELRPALHFRPHEGSLGVPLDEPYSVNVVEDRFEFAAAMMGTLPPLRVRAYGNAAAFTIERRYLQEVLYRTEEARGYESRGDLWSPGYFRFELQNSEWATLAASTESWDTIRALEPNAAWEIDVTRLRRLISQAHPQAREGMAAELVLAADQFIVTPTGRVEDMARARALGDEVRTIIAGYHWFTDWGRDTMISLEGLTLATCRHTEAGWILRTFARYVRDGLIPNMFPEGEKEGLYHTADATLWFFHALDRYIDVTADHHTLHTILPTMIDIVEHHLRGTRFGIGVDPDDGLLRQGAPGYQLTWMDAKVDDWVVTPRRGKAVEINALWYNALRLLEGWLRKGYPEDASRIGGFAARVYESFNRRFWYEGGGYLYDVVDTEGGGDDPALRPNQLFAISLCHPVLEESRWERVVRVCEERLLTPVGLRSLAPGHADYKSNYRGNLRERDAAYHQGTVWAWLIGPFIDAWLRVHPGENHTARRFLAGFEEHLSDDGVGSISEVFDAEPPYTPRACVAQAWSVAEVLRCWVKTAG